MCQYSYRRTHYVIFIVWTLKSTLLVHWVDIINFQAWEPGRHKDIKMNLGGIGNEVWIKFPAFEQGKSSTPLFQGGHLRGGRGIAGSSFKVLFLREVLEDHRFKFTFKRGIAGSSFKVLRFRYTFDSHDWKFYFWMSHNRFMIYCLALEAFKNHD